MCQRWGQGDWSRVADGTALGEGTDWLADGLWRASQSAGGDYVRCTVDVTDQPAGNWKDEGCISQEPSEAEG